MVSIPREGVLLSRSGREGNRVALLQEYTMESETAGLKAALTYPLFDALINRRSRRISKGIPEVRAGSLTYTSQQKPQPLSPLEEAVLIAATGTTGVTVPDRPFQDQSGQSILGTPNLNMVGRAAGSTDNAQATHFFLINDEGTYLLKRVPAPPVSRPVPEDELMRRAAQSKHLLQPGRLSFPRQFPYFLDSNRFLSNAPGSTILFPVVDMTQQYINALMYLLTEPEGSRPVFVDDRNFYLPAGVKKWMRNGFLNKEIKFPLGVLGPMRTQIEADLLLQNLMLVIQAMGLGGALAAGATPQNLSLPEIVNNIKWASDYISSHAGPTWNQIFPDKAVDGQAAEKGKIIYLAQCDSCHGHPEGNRWVPGEKDGQLTLLQDIRTDQERVTFRGYEELPDLLAAYFPKTHPFQFPRDGLRPPPRKNPGDMVERGFINKRMHAMFSRTPFLHNASILTLAELINLTDRKPVFFRGHNEYDVDLVGLKSPGEKEHNPRDQKLYFRFDTSLPGNSNRGHDYPWTRMDVQTDEKKQADLRNLLEYLKTL
jgi:hypothetical protein